MTVTIYGIKNCNSMKKTFDWFDQKGLEYDFVDYKKAEPTEKQIETWIDQLGWDQVINKKGMTWRKLDEQTKEKVNKDNAAKLALTNLSIIKRPLIVNDDSCIVGYDEEAFSSLLS